MLHPYGRRFGGIGTIVTLDDGRAFTAAHCLAPVDGASGVVIGNGHDAWRVLKRWSPKRTDLAVLRALPAPGRARGSRVPGWPADRVARVPTRVLVRPGVCVEFVGHTGQRFARRAATVIAVTATSATAVVEHRTGVCANDSGGPVFVLGVLVGIVTHRTGPARSPRCSSQLVFTRLDAPAMRRRLHAAFGRGDR